MKKPEKKQYVKAVTPEGRVCFPNLFISRQFEGDGKHTWSCMLIFDKAAQASEGFAKLKTIVGDQMKKEHGPDPKKWGDWKNPLKNASTYKGGKLLEYNGVKDGDIVVNLSKTDWSKDEKAPKETTAPQVIVNNMVISAAESSKFYAGCYAKASVAVGYFSAKGNYGVHFILNGVLKTKDGEPLGARNDVFSDFGIDPEKALESSSEESFEF